MITTVKSERACFLETEYKKKWGKSPDNIYEALKNEAALTKYSQLPKWEKHARASYDAMVGQELYIEEYDRIIGRVFWNIRAPVTEKDPDLDFMKNPVQQVESQIAHYDEMWQNQLFSRYAAIGHITWRWDWILKYGVSGLREKYQKLLAATKDEKASEFYQGVLIQLDGITDWNKKHVEKLKEMNMLQMAKICERVPEYPAQTFHEAVQAFYMQYLAVMSENPYGGNGPGRLDYFLWPYLEEDLKIGTCTLQEARELIDELFLRFDESVHMMDGWGTTVSVGGTGADGKSSVTPLTYIMIQSFMDLNVTHPYFYLRVPKDAPKEYLEECARYLKYGHNRAQILNDEAIMKAMMATGVSYEDAIDYCCGGCMEISSHGRNCDFLYQGWHNIPKYVELAITGGKCLVTQKQLQSTRFKGLASYSDFEAFYQDVTAEIARYIKIFFKVQDMFSQEAASTRPAYLISSMIEDCAEKGRNMHDGGARYHYYSTSPLAMANAADALFAVKKAVFDEKFCTAQKLADALAKDFEGEEALRLKLFRLPKYGQQNPEADAFAARFMTDICKAYEAVKVRFDGVAMPMVLTFVYAPIAASILGATADGNHAGKLVAQGITPQSTSMTEGITAAIGSSLQMPWERFGGGATTMWDFDPKWASQEVIQAVLTTFLKGGGQIFQGNTTDVEELLEAQKHPDEYGHLIVRVGGFSARFTWLDPELQKDIITRYRHAG